MAEVGVMSRAPEMHEGKAEAVVAPCSLPQAGKSQASGQGTGSANNPV